MIPPDGRHTGEYSPWPGINRAASLVIRRCTDSSAPGPKTSTSPMWETSNRPAAVRTAWCSSTMPAYCTGISQPPNSTIRAPAARCTSYRLVRLRCVLAISHQLRD